MEEQDRTMTPNPQLRDAVWPSLLSRFGTTGRFRFPQSTAAKAGPGASRTLALARLGVIGLSAFALSACVVAPPRRVVHASAPAAARPAMYFYPSQGQSVERQDRDRFECYQWARNQTGTDPGMTPIRGPAPEYDAPQVTGAGAAVGAVAGAAIGAAGSTSGPRYGRGRGGGGSAEGMIMGAIIGSIIGAAAENAGAEAQARANEARARRDAAGVDVPLDGFRRAMGACMSSRGYSIG